MFPYLPRRPGKSFGQRARVRFLLVGTLGFLLACSNDDGGPARPDDEPRGVRLDASIPELPGEGLSPPPDITDREVTPVPSDRYIDSIIDVIDAFNPDSANATPEAGALDAAADAGADGAL